MIDVASGDLYWYHYDGLGSVVALSKYDSSAGYASIVERYVYDVFGQTTVTDGSGTPLNPNESAYGNPYMFTGRRFDPETGGVYYYRARLYIPAIGRFLQPDPIGYADSMNLYQYCGNNPVNFIDPWGLIPKDSTPSVADSLQEFFDSEPLEKLDDMFPGIRKIVPEVVDNAYEIGQGLSQGRGAIKQQESQWGDLDITDFNPDQLGKDRRGAYIKGAKGGMKIVNALKGYMTIGVSKLSRRSEIRSPSPPLRPPTSMPGREGKWGRGHRTDKPYNPKQRYR